MSIKQNSCVCYRVKEKCQFRLFFSYKGECTIFVKLIKEVFDWIF